MSKFNITRFSKIKNLIQLQKKENCFHGKFFATVIYLKNVWSIFVLIFAYQKQILSFDLLPISNLQTSWNPHCTFKIYNYVLCSIIRATTTHISLVLPPLSRLNVAASVLWLVAHLSTPLWRPLIKKTGFVWVNKHSKVWVCVSLWICIISLHYHQPKHSCSCRCCWCIDDNDDDHKKCTFIHWCWFTNWYK